MLNFTHFLAFRRPNSCLVRMSRSPIALSGHVEKMVEGSGAR